MRVVHCVLPAGIDDPATPSGGNRYDRRLITGLTALGWSVREHAVRDDLPAGEHAADRHAAGRHAAGRHAAGRDLSAVLAALPPDGPVLADGLVASAAPELFRPLADRLVVLVHRPFGTAAEAALFAAARAVVTTSHWAAGQVEGRVTAAPPGVDPAPLAAPSAAGCRLLCVAVVAPHKGHDLLLPALAAVPGPSLVCVGSLARDPAYAAAVQAAAPPGRVRFAGPLVGAALDAAYAAADLLVLPSREETYGMVLTEALARGIPVLATAVGGVPEAVGAAPDGTVPGLLVPPSSLTDALRSWVADAGLRARLRRAARERRDRLTGWDVTAATVAGVLA